MTLSGFTKPTCAIRECVLVSVKLRSCSVVKPVPKAYQRAILEYKIVGPDEVTGLPEWCRDVAYLTGSVVRYQGHKWTAKQWNYNEVPGGNSGAWIDDGPCFATRSNCAGIPRWKRDTAYVAGDVVSFHGDKWTAIQWNYNEFPGGVSGAWHDEGPC
ncbi:hypothetical protein OPQ81_008220 [Rhizoctonia solani]|nr:hypothetical protein OPQ81_008220 [Rhizoctonia solani]